MTAQPSIDIVLDGAARSIEEGTTGTSLFASERDVVAMRVDGEPWDLERAVPAGAVVVGSPSRGATYLGPVADVELVYPTRVRPREGSAELALARATSSPRPGSVTCDLLNRLGAQYYVDVRRRPDGLRYGNAPLRWDDRIDIWSTRGMKLVSWADTEHGSVSLWRITVCG